MPHNFGEDDRIYAGESNYKELFNSYWCPLLGRMPATGSMDQNSDESRSVEIIENARELWGINPFRQYEATDNLIESSIDETKETFSYPQWRLDAAQVIALTYPQTKQDINAEEYNCTKE